MKMKRTSILTAALFAGSMIAVPAYAASPTMPTKPLVEISNDDVLVTSLGMKVEELVGMDIYGADGEKIGDIASVLSDAAHNAQAVTVDVGGFLGVGSKKVVIPIERLKTGPKDGTLGTAMTKDEIEQLSE